MSNVILLVSCPEQRGITSAITTFIFENNGNIIHADQHIDDQTDTFFMRVEWSLDGFKIDREDIEKIFERFYTINKSHSRQLGGAGLGLSIVKTILSKHDAKISVNSTVGKGTTFTLIFEKSTALSL